MVLLAAVVSLLFLLLLFALWNLPWILRYMSVDPVPVEVGGALIAVSDVHVGASEGIRVIGAISRSLNADHIVVAGDLIDKPLTPSSLPELVEVLKRVFSELGFRGTLIYVLSRSFHDIRLEGGRPLELRIDGSRAVIVPGAASIKLENCAERIVVTHGDYVSRNGTLAMLLDLIGVKLFGAPVTGLALRRFLKLKSYDWLVYGHSHVAYVDRARRIVNTGTWIPVRFAGKRTSLRGKGVAAAFLCRGGGLEVSAITVRLFSRVFLSSLTAQQHPSAGPTMMAPRRLGFSPPSRGSLQPSRSPP